MAGNCLRAENNQIETTRTIQRIIKTTRWFFEKINKIDKLLAILSRGHRDSIQINKTRNEKRDITMETMVIKKKPIRSYYNSLYSTILENLGETENSLDIYQVAKLNRIR